MSVKSSFIRPYINLSESNILTNGETHPPGIRNFPDLIRFNAIHNPNHLFCVQLSSDQKETRITFLEIAHAVEECCTWLLSHIKGIRENERLADGEKNKPIAIFLESDVSLLIYLTALVTIHVPCLLLSIRLSPPAIVHLLNQTQSISILVSDRTRPNVEAAISQNENLYSTTVNLVPTFKTFLAAPTTLNSDPLGRWATSRHLCRDSDRNVIILHSSGTTGLPKAISLAHRYLLGYATCHLFPSDIDESCQGLNVSTLPLFHGFGFLAPCLALSVGKPCVLLPASEIPTGALVVSVIRRLPRITSLMSVPMIMEEVTLLEDFEDVTSGILKKLDFIAVGGGGLNAVVGEKLHSRGIKLLNHFGATELGALAPIFRPDPTYEYQYLRLRTDLGLRLEKLDSEDGVSGLCKLFGYPFAWDKEFELQDRLVSNPLRPNSEVKIMGRKDDMIVLSTGEKVFPQATESLLEQDPLIRRAVVFGNSQAEVGVLLEPAIPMEEPTSTFIDRVWPSILKSNNLADRHARIYNKAAILVKPITKTIPLSDKGSTQRQATYNVFEPEISLVYHMLENPSEEIEFPLDYQDIKTGLRSMVQDCLPTHSQERCWQDDDDLIHLGLDSLQATRLLRILNTSISKLAEPINNLVLPRNFVYSHPTVSRIAQSLEILFEKGREPPDNSAANMADLYFKYCYTASRFSGNTNTVLITGSTGSLGAHLVEVLCANNHVDHVICLIRLPVATQDFNEALRTRQQSAFDARGISLCTNAWSKIELLQWIPDEPFLGLGSELYQLLASRITHIFHGAWPMDFKRHLSSFEPQIKTLKTILDLALKAHAVRPDIKVKVVFASSIAVVGRYGMENPTNIVPEVIMHDPAVTLPMGYAEAKYVCEKIMESAHVTLSSQLQPIIVRIGQVSGSRTNGSWSQDEHFPVLVRTSQAIGKLPDLKGTLSWLPVDQAAQVSAELLLDMGPQDLIFHIENPVRQLWPDICTILEQNLGFSPFSRIPFTEWLDQVWKSDDCPESLMDFFQNHFLTMSDGSLILDTNNCRRVSRTLRSVSAVSPGCVEKYLQFWSGNGMLQ